MIAHIFRRFTSCRLKYYNFINLSGSCNHLSSSSILHVKRKYPILPEKAEDLPVFQYPVADPADKRIYVWGLAEHGALGNHAQNRKPKVIKRHFFLPVRLQFGELHKVVDIACGYGFTAFAVLSKDKHKVFGCGINTDSQLGYHEVRRNHPLSIILNPVPVDIPFDSPNTVQIKQVSAGRAHLLVLTETEGVYLLGNNAYGQCGRKIIENEDYSGNPIINNVPHLEGDKIDKIECGQDHSLFITETGKVYTCGWGADGQTGSGYFGNSYHPSQVKGDIEGEIITKVACSVDCVLALNNKGEVFGWGNSEYGQLVPPEEKVQVNAAVYLKKCCSLGKIVDIAAGGSFCMAVNGENKINFEKKTNKQCLHGSENKNLDVDDLCSAERKL